MQSKSGTRRALSERPLSQGEYSLGESSPGDPSPKESTLLGDYSPGDYSPNHSERRSPCPDPLYKPGLLHSAGRASPELLPVPYQVYRINNLHLKYNKSLDFIFSNKRTRKKLLILECESTA